MTPLSRPAAQSLIVRIRSNSGGMSPKVAARTPPEALEALRNLTKVAATAAGAFVLPLPLYLESKLISLI